MTSMMNKKMLSDKLELPAASGKYLPNRLVKASTTESLADPNTSLPNRNHNRLYKQWANGGCGMIITGNVMIDRKCREAPRNVVLDEANEDDLQPFQHWADSMRTSIQNPLVIMQLNHPGRQSPLSVTGLFSRPKAPSGGAKGRIRLPGMLGKIVGRLAIRSPSELKTDEIQTIIQQFAVSARLAEAAGFDGIQIHAAHGYLLSQFLSTSANLRTDDYGGDRKRRRRLLLEVIDAVIDSTSSTFVVGVKINCKDHSTDGLEKEDECLELATELCQKRIDFIELSGGGFEEGLMVSQSADGNGFSFIRPFSERLNDAMEKDDSSSKKPPLVVQTGGFRTTKGMETVIQEGKADLIGLARPLCIDPAIARGLLSGMIDAAPSENIQCFFAKALLDPALNSLWYQRQIELLSIGKDSDPNLSILYTLSFTFARCYIWDPALLRISPSLVAFMSAGAIVGMVGAIFLLTK